MRIQPIAEGAFSTNTYIVYGCNGDGCILIDAPFPYEGPEGFISANGLRPQALLLTHGHFDHIFGIPAIRKAYPDIRIYIAEEDMHYLEDNAEESMRMASMLDPITANSLAAGHLQMPDDILTYGDECMGFSILRTPGHTSGSVCIYSEKENVLFSGDTLFRYGTGRTDLGGSDRDIMASLRTLLELPDDTIVLPGHGPMTTIKDERKGNPFL